ncbi:MAG: hypothetical protein HY900_29175 [Deltaproteobacteria bacterium]|nr:hypothetical protein [Deltaproteobacteria bacterium]
MREISYAQAINEALAEEMARDEKVFLLGESIRAGGFGLTSGLVQVFGPERVLDTPICETAIAGAGVGASMAGYRPVIDLLFADFLHIAGDEVLLKAGQWRFVHGGRVQLPVVFFAGVGGGMQLGSEHSQTPASLVLRSPGLKLALPSDPHDAKGLLKTAIRDDNPVCFFWHKALLKMTGPVPDGEYTVPFGVACVRREGTDVTVVGASNMVNLALAVAEELKDRVSVEVIDPRTLEPLDLETICASVRKTGRLVVVDEDRKRCGFAAELAAQVMEREFHSLDAPVQRVAAENLPIAGGHMEAHVLPQPEQIRRAIEAVLA